MLTLIYSPTFANHLTLTVHSIPLRIAKVVECYWKVKTREKLMSSNYFPTANYKLWERNIFVATT